MFIVKRCRDNHSTGKSWPGGHWCGKSQESRSDFSYRQSNLGVVHGPVKMGIDQNCFAPFWKGVYCKRKEFAPKGRANSFLLKWTHWSIFPFYGRLSFRWGLVCREAKRNSQKTSTLYKVAESGVSSPYIVLHKISVPGKITTQWRKWELSLLHATRLIVLLFIYSNIKTIHWRIKVTYNFKKTKGSQTVKLGLCPPARRPPGHGKKI